MKENIRNNIGNIEKTLFDIKTALLQNENIRKLLYYDTPDALEKVAAPSISELVDNISNEDKDDYITLVPVMEKGVLNYGRNTFIMILSSLTSFEEDEFYSGITVAVITDQKSYMLNNDRTRLLQLSNEIISSIDNKKFSAAGKVEVVSMNPIVYDFPVYGYEIKFMFADSGEGSEF